VLGSDDVTTINTQGAQNQLDEALQLKMKVGPRSVASHPDVGFILQADMAYENEFTSDVDMTITAGLDQILDQTAYLSYPKIESDFEKATDKRKLTTVRKRKAEDAIERLWNDTDSVKSCASFVRSRAATLRLAAERLKASHGRANRLTSTPDDTLTFTDRLIKVSN